MEQFKEDRLENEKKDPSENSSLRFIWVPISLLSMFFGFGVTYLSLRTDNTEISSGDSRTLLLESSNLSGDAKLQGAPDPVNLAEEGKRIYATVCQACHQETGAGIPGAFPPLDGSEWVTGSPRQVAAIIAHGLQGEIKVKGQVFNSMMPPFKDQLSQGDIAAVATYVRQAWSNKAPPVTVEIVQGVISDTKDRNSPWAGADELKKQKWE